MEVSGILCRSLEGFSGTGLFTQSSQFCFFGQSTDSVKQFPCEFRFLSTRDSKIYLRSRKFSRVSSSGFTDNGHLLYYVSPRSGDKKEKGLKTMTLKRMLKFIKVISKSLNMFPEIGLEKIKDFQGEDDNGKTVSEVTEVLLVQLQQLREEEKVMKRNRKKEEAKMKAARRKARKENSSSSSSESSDSESGEVIDMSRLRSETLKLTKINESPEKIQAEVTLTSPGPLMEDQITVKQSEDLRRGNNGERSVMEEGSKGRIEICMGGKCKKLGGKELLEEFERRVGVNGAVMGCKCMGKCRDGPNVRVLSSCDMNLTGEDKGFVKSQTKSLCIGVGLEDVGAILANLGSVVEDKKKNLGFMAA